MASHQGMLTLVLMVTLVVGPSSGTMLTVTPSSTYVTCPTENTCLILSEYAQHHSEYFNHSNITLQFLPGNHTLDVNLTITSIQTQYLEILGNTTSPTPSTITCSHKVGFEFRDILKVRVSNITFISCGRGYQLQHPPNYVTEFHCTIRFSSVQLTKVTNCVFRDSFGSAVGIVNSTALVSGNNNFSSNCRKCSGGCPYLSVCFGGGIYAEGSNVTFYGNNTFHGNSALLGGGVFAMNSNVTFHNGNTFHENSAEYDGGGVYAWNSNVAFYGNNTFHDNSAEYDGGGVYAWNSNVAFYGNNTFLGNSATYGGGVYALHSNVTFYDNNTFHDNSAKYDGGGVHAWNSNVTFHDNNTFHENSAEYDGGGVYALHSNVTFHDNNTFHENSAESDGGGVFAWNSNVRFSGTGTFTDNTAQYDGGGIYSDNSIIDIGGITKIQNNTAQQDGGGIYMRRTYMILAGMNAFIANKANISGGGILVDNGNLTLIGSNYFEECTARYQGGGISTYASTINLPGNDTFLSNSATLRGGGISARWSLLSFTNSSIFSKNFAESGGGIFTDNSTLHFGGLNTIEHNSADLGGGICMLNSSLDFLGKKSFILNSATKDGGGIYSDNSTIDIGGITKIQNNTAQQDGGGIYMSRTNLTLAGINTFTTNSAMQGGGILAAAGSTVVSDGMNTFIANKANISGGGILVDNGNLTLIGRHYFEECTARYQGGGILTYASTINLPGPNTFLSNSATLRGGGICAHQSHFSFTNSSNFSKNFAKSGGGIFIDNSTLDFGGLNTIERNSADLGGGIYMLNSSLDFQGNNSFILNNATKDGGGIYARENDIIYLSGSNIFQRNTAAERGGGIFVKDSNLTSRTRTVSTNNVITDFNETAMKFPGYSEFCRNSAMTGGGLYSIDSTLEFPETYTFNFTANMATNAGGGFATVGSTINTIGSMAFETNSAMSGGGMYLEDTKVNLSARNYFNQNHAHYEGGAVYIRAGNVTFSGTDHFVSNSAAMRGGSLSAACTNLTFSGTTTFNNSTSQQGGAIHVVSSYIIFECVTELWNNSAQYGGAIFSEKSTVSFGKPSCRGSLGSDFTPEPGSSFINNTALWGGAMHLDHHSSIRFHPSACVHFNCNKARGYGGAIFVVDSVGKNTFPPVMDLPSRNECFFHVISNEISQMGKINLIFESNTAGKSGSVLYGGMLNKCNYSYSEEYTDTINLFNRSIVHETYTAETAAISSDPMLCFCSESGSLECEYEVQNEDRFPGQKVNVSLIAIDQTYTPIQTDIHTNLISDEKYNSTVCTNRSYTITSPKTNNTLLFYPTTASGNPIPAVLNVTFQDCPIGFEQSNSTYECICDHRLQKFTNSCNIETQTLLRTGRLNGTFWVNASFNNETLDGYIRHSQCPLNYCTKQQRFINLNNPDEQCDFNHTGLLCGKCRENFSLILGSFRCEECSSEYLALLIPFALAGVALVILLFLLKLTVATGTLHGLIFYANVVAANHHIFFPPDNYILARIFIAWLNLDLGIETCFYNGMDAYSKTCLQIVFPLYIWGIVGFLIYISKRSRRVTQLLGTNPVAVLDTLFLLSYTKLLHTIITALSLTTLHYPQNDRVVWLYDASIPMQKLIPFFIAALIFLVFLFLPYTLLLLLGQWFCTVSDFKLIKSCCEKHPRMKLRLKAILDPYHAPYKPKRCYWTGLLLLLRCVLLLVSAFNISGEKDSVNLLAILSSVGVILAVLVLSGKVYRSWYLNTLEVLFLLNLIILTAATYHVRLVNGNQAAVAYISVGVAFLTFVGIITYHVNLQMKWKLQHLPRYFRMIKKSCKNHSVESKIDVENSHAQNSQQETRPLGPTMTVVDLRSPLDLIDADRDVIETVQ